MDLYLLLTGTSFIRHLNKFARNLSSPLTLPKYLSINIRSIGTHVCLRAESFVLKLQNTHMHDTRAT